MTNTLLINKSIFFGVLIFLINEVYFLIIIIFLLCFGLYLSIYIKSLYITKLFIELILPFLILDLFFIYFLSGINIFVFYFKIDNFFILFKVILFFFLYFCLYLSRFYFILEKIKFFEFIIIILLSIESSIFILLSMNLFFIYIFFEIQNLCYYILTILKKYNNFSVEAGLKYFLFGSFSSSLMLFGISLFYSLLGTLELYDMFYIFINFNYKNNNFLIFIAMFYFLCGLFLKLGSVPFHR